MLVSGLNVFSGFRSCLLETFTRSCRQSIRSQPMQSRRSSSHEEGPSLLTMLLFLEETMVRLSWHAIFKSTVTQTLKPGRLATDLPADQPRHNRIKLDAQPLPSDRVPAP